jgi:hypothetical protein
MDFLEIPNVITLVKYQADRFSSEHLEHTEDVNTFVRELNRITSELQTAVYARQKTERGW